MKTRWRLNTENVELQTDFFNEILMVQNLKYLSFFSCVFQAQFDLSQMLKWENLQPVNVRQKDNRTGCCRNHSDISGAFVWPQLPISCSTGCLPNYLGGVRAARTSLCILYILCTCYLADIAFPPIPEPNFSFGWKRTERKMFSSSAFERLQKVIWISGVGDRR